MEQHLVMSLREILSNVWTARSDETLYVCSSCECESNVNTFRSSFLSNRDENRISSAIIEGIGEKISREINFDWKLSKEICVRF